MPTTHSSVNFQPRRALGDDLRTLPRHDKDIVDHVRPWWVLQTVTNDADKPINEVACRRGGANTVPVGRTCWYLDGQTTHPRQGRCIAPTRMVQSLYVQVARLMPIYQKLRKPNAHEREREKAQRGERAFLNGQVTVSVRIKISPEGRQRPRCKRRDDTVRRGLWSFPGA